MKQRFPGRHGVKGVFDLTLIYKIKCFSDFLQVACVSPSTAVSSGNKVDGHNISKMMFNVSGVKHR